MVGVLHACASLQALDQVKHAHEKDDNMLLEWEFALIQRQRGVSFVSVFYVGQWMQLPGQARQPEYVLLRLAHHFACCCVCHARAAYAYAGSEEKVNKPFGSWDVNAFPDAPHVHKDSPHNARNIKTKDGSKCVVIFWPFRMCIHTQASPSSIQSETRCESCLLYKVLFPPSARRQHLLRCARYHCD